MNGLYQPLFLQPREHTSHWGTADPDSIANLIRDNNDSDEACFIIDYEPFETESTPVENMSLSDLKGLFR